MKYTWQLYCDVAIYLLAAVIIAQVYNASYFAQLRPQGNLHWGGIRRLFMIK